MSKELTIKFDTPRHGDADLMTSGLLIVSHELLLYFGIEPSLR